jgi:phosphotransferase system enzyme I (PtsI)
LKQDYLRQRADDIRNVGNLLINRMKGARPGLVLPEGESKVLLAAYELTPADTFLLDKKRLGGLITEQGGATSHTVILVKSMGIPAITGVRQVLSALGRHQNAVMDGQTGELILDPDAQTVQNCLQKQNSQRAFREKVDRLGCRQAVTKDGEIIRLCANIGSPRDMDALQNEEYDGIGLFRTEFLYADSAAEPIMAEQEAAYRAVLERADGREVIIRTLDIGGDKEVPYLCLPKEQNPFLGNRGLRLCLENRSKSCSQW